jgi:hypothetical protein
MKAKHNSKPTVTIHGLSEAVMSMPLHVCQKNNRHHFTALPTHYSVTGLKQKRNIKKNQRKLQNKLGFMTTVKQRIIQDSNLHG